ncbi:hypothetical protein [Desertivirga arenae]|uniref:hypothetical protein n=1 Tax=Desertivirga arenae TaxID=2810309 RepID=UPI001A969072|nr:hypothetical protein [Pedobacter sp. SYSU D00823]
MNTTTIYSITAGLLSLLLIRTSPVWSREIGGFWNILFFLIICILLIILLVDFIKGLVKLFKNRKALKLNLFFPILIALAVFLDLQYNLFKIDLTSLYGKTTFRACFEGTQNQATFELKGKDRFELHWTGVFFYDKYYVGSYRKTGDTLFLTYKTDKPMRFGEKVLMDNTSQRLVVIKSKSDSSQFSVPFYYGYCKGLN